MASLVETFLTHVRGSDRVAPAAVFALEETLARVDAEARAGWPLLALGSEEFIAYLAERLPPEGDPLELLEKVRAADLYFTCCLARNIPAAMADFETRHGAALRRHLKRVARRPSGEEDLYQDVLTRLFVGVDRRPRIADYAGIGSFEGWLKVVSMRVALNQLEKIDREHLGGERDIGEEPLANAVDPELERMRQKYQAEFSSALSDAFARMALEDRTLLRFHLLDRLSIDEIAPLVRVHRSNVARRLATARKRLVDKTQETLQERIGVDSVELESILRMVRSQLDLNLERLLLTRAG
jgi:RNA polymerase sigma-70 factor, ECF subfamily